MQLDLAPGRKVYFASDFHLGFPDAATSLARERRIVRWLDQAAKDADHIFLVGDLFDFWFEYRHVVPKGFVRFLGKLAALQDQGIQIWIFPGNHDLWMWDYLHEQTGARIIHEPVTLRIGTKQFRIGHGDGLGPGDHTYKLLRRFLFKNPLCVWAFGRLIHPDWGIGFADAWSRSSKRRGLHKAANFYGQKGEWIWSYCREVEAIEPHDYYVFGHRHLPLDLPVGDHARYINLGEWLHYYTYAHFDGTQLLLIPFEEDTAHLIVRQ